jgi:hypothetical protein
MVGLKVTLKVQVAAGAKDAPQVFVWAKSPVTLTPLIASATTVLFFTVTALAALVTFRTVFVNVKEVGVTVICAVPVPEKATDCAMPPTLKLRVPVRVEATLGVNTTLMLQDAAAANEAPQVLVCEKSVLAVMPVIETEPVWLFVIVTGLDALGVATGWLPKASEVGDTVKAASPLPLKLAEGLGPDPTVAVIVPGRDPVATGLKVTLMVQVAPAAIEAPQSLV